MTTYLQENQSGSVVSTVTTQEAGGAAIIPESSPVAEYAHGAPKLDCVTECPPLANSKLFIRRDQYRVQSVDAEARSHE